MANEEIVKALRLCAKSDCSSCGMCPIFPDRECVEHLATAAASLIEQLIDENTELREEVNLRGNAIRTYEKKRAEAEAERDALLEIAKQGKDCKTCKNNEVCVQPGIDVAHWCDRCAEKCPCYGCEGGHWEWRGLPAAQMVFEGMEENVL